MANKKIWAYAKDVNGEFILDEKGRTKLFFIWQVLKMKKEETFEFNNLTFYSTQQVEEKRARMAPVNRGFFRYIENSGGGGNYSGDSESLSHSIAILVLSELGSINFVFGQKEYRFQFTDIRADDVKIRLESGNEYYPDLIGVFSPENPFHEKWGGKVAIEVKVTHECEPKKVRDFEDHNIPIIEINITEALRFKKELYNKPFDEKDLENYYRWLNSKFSKKVYGKILSDPVSIKFHKNLVAKLKEENFELSNRLGETQHSKNLLQQRISDVKEKFLIQDEKNSDMQNKIRDLKAKINCLENKSFLQNLHSIFRSIFGKKVE